MSPRMKPRLKRREKNEFQRPVLWPRLVGVVAATALGVYYIGHVILGVSPGAPKDFEVRVEVPEAPGVYEDGDVTYHGVSVGTIDRINVTEGSVELVLKIRAGEKVPADSNANVRMLSALGEQYVDLAPRSTGGRMLKAGDVIPPEHTSVPVPVGKALSSGKVFLDSLDPTELQTVETLLAQAFGDVTPELKRLVETGQDLTEALIAGQQGTEQLVLDGKTVLRAGNATSKDLTTYVASLDKLSKRFADSDSDIDSLLGNGGPALADVEDLISTEQGPWRDLMTGAGAAGNAITRNDAAVDALFAILPAVSGKLATAGNGKALTGQITLNDGDPLCTFSKTLPTPGTQTKSGSAHTKCSQVRGPANAP